jgi:hypothetical protein
MKLQILTATIGYKIEMPKGTIIDPLDLEHFREKIKRQLKKEGLENPTIDFTTVQIQ